jgi:hypothetical protein
MKKNNKWALLGVLALDAAITLLAVFISNIARFISSSSDTCLMKLFGLTCPSCGGTRCVYNFFKGNFTEAFGYNQFVFVMIFYALALVVLLNLQYVFGLNFPKKPIKYMVHPITLIVIVALYVTFGIVRNVILFV